MDQSYKPKTWSCFTCGANKAATANQLKRKNCSKECMSLAYKLQMIGEKNPNYKNKGLKKCFHCNQDFKSYIKNRKFCSHPCYIGSKTKSTVSKVPQEKNKPNTKICKFCEKSFVCSASSSKTTCSEDCKKQQRIKKQLFRSCLKCGNEFKHYASQKKVYCSYQCHLDNGGAFRAGIAASGAKMKYGAKKDANHSEIILELRKHCAVYDLSDVGRGVPDGVAWINNAWHLFDIKNPKTGYGRRGLNEVQKKWISMWPGGPVYLIYTAEEAENFAKGNFEKIKSSKG